MSTSLIHYPLKMMKWLVFLLVLPYNFINSDNDYQQYSILHHHDQIALAKDTQPTQPGEYNTLELPVMIPHSHYTLPCKLVSDMDTTEFNYW